MSPLRAMFAALLLIAVAGPASGMPSIATGCEEPEVDLPGDALSCPPGPLVTKALVSSGGVLVAEVEAAWQAACRERAELCGSLERGLLEACRDTAGPRQFGNGTPLGGDDCPPGLPKWVVKALCAVVFFWTVLSTGDPAEAMYQTQRCHHNLSG